MRWELIKDDWFSASLALILGLHHYRPSPFYVMDEIDAALDYRNVSITSHLLKVDSDTAAKSVDGGVNIDSCLGADPERSVLHSLTQEHHVRDW